VFFPKLLIICAVSLIFRVGKVWRRSTLLLFSSPFFILISFQPPFINTSSSPFSLCRHFSFPSAPLLAATVVRAAAWGHGSEAREVVRGGGEGMALGNDDERLWWRQCESGSVDDGSWWRCLDSEPRGLVAWRARGIARRALWRSEWWWGDADGSGGASRASLKAVRCTMGGGNWGFWRFGGSCQGWLLVVLMVSLMRLGGEGLAARGEREGLLVVVVEFIFRFFGEWCYDGTQRLALGDGGGNIGCLVHGGRDSSESMMVTELSGLKINAGMASGCRNGSGWEGVMFSKTKMK